MPEPDQPDAPQPASSEEVFDYGDRTILQLRSQPFDVANEPDPAAPAPEEADAHDPTRTRAIPMPEEAAAAVRAADDPIARVEQKLDLALRQIAAMQQRLESLDATLMKILTR